MITPRLEKILELIKGDNIADIGTDHAYIPIRLAQENRIKKAIACDLNKGPLEAAKTNIKKYGFEELIECRLGSGLNPIKKGEVSEIVIAGMGGKLIGDILEENLEIAKASILILQPMNAQYELRKRLEKLGFNIIEETLEKEGLKIYNFMIVKAGTLAKREEFNYHIPKELYNHPLVEMLVNKKKREFTKILEGQRKKEEKDEALIAYYEEMIINLNKITI